MNRLTYKQKWTDYFTDEEHHYNTKDDYAIDKLGKLEDIEEELRCPLDVVFKALKEGIVLNNGILYKCKLSYIEKELIFVCYANITDTTGVNVKDYQKTWWLKGENDEKED